MKAPVLRILLLGLPFLFPLGLALDLWLGSHRDDAGQAVTSQVRYGENQEAPEWMPKEWISAYLREIRLDSQKSIFSRDLKDVSQALSDSPWVRSVDTVRRDYKGNMVLKITPRKPICVIRRKNRLDRYLDGDLVEMPVLNFREPEKLREEVLPVVLVGSLINQDEHDREVWLREMIDFLKEWSVAGLQDRLSLHIVDMVPYRSETTNVCRLKLMTKDLKFKGPVIVEWGVHQEFSVLEGRASAQKWEDLGATLGQDRPFSSLDLRYQALDIGR
jgi:hypothetical protein